MRKQTSDVFIFDMAADDVVGDAWCWAAKAVVELMSMRRAGQAGSLFCNVCCNGYD